MWIVKIALSRPYTFIVLALLLLIIGPLTILRTPTDIFPNIGIPVISVIWNYTGLPAEEMGNRVTSTFERVVPTTVNDVEHIESQSLVGVSVVKVFFQPNVNTDLAMAQLSSIAQTMLRNLPPGTTPPAVILYNASTVPVIQLALSSTTIPEQDINDFANSFLRNQLASIPGVAMPYPYGGKSRQIQVDLDQLSMQGHHVSAQDVNAAIGAQNLILPAGTEKIGPFEYSVRLNASLQTIEELNELPVKQDPGKAIVKVSDVAHVRDGFSPQTNIVRVDGQRAVLMSLLKIGDASTLSVIAKLKELLPKVREGMPPGLNLTTLADQSLFVSAAVQGVVREAVIAAVLTGLMILLFLGSWRSTLIITISIPLSILASIICLSALGQTINIMTLGGLALAVGILVDDATVAIENINWHLEQGKDVEPAILDGAQQIAIPALVSTLCICIVFVPMFFLTGVAKYLFIPMAEAVVFAMIASYILSRTLVPTLAKYWLKKHVHRDEHEALHGKRPNLFQRIQHGFEHRFERLRKRYHVALASALDHRGWFIGLFLAFTLLSVGILGIFLGSDFFPTVDAGQIKLHLRAHSGLRVEETARLCDEIDAAIRKAIPADQLDNITDNIGIPNSGINLSYSNSAPIGPSDADILVSLKPNHKPTEIYIRKLRESLNRDFPGVMFAFLPADIVSQILNFGLPAPIDVQVIGYKKKENREYALKLFEEIRRVPGIVDSRIQQVTDYPELHVSVDRARAQELGLTQHDVATSMLVTLSGSFQTAPTFWLNPKNGVSYPIVTQAPQYDLTSLDALKNIPITSPVGSQIVGGLAGIVRASGSGVETHYNVQPVIDIYAAIDGRDLGGVARDINRIIAKNADTVPKGSTVVARGQMLTQASSFKGLYSGLAFAIVLVYLLIVVNFQSWLDPFIIITALPGALAGIVWMLFITHTTLSVPALTGAIMCMGVATANSILIVSFARERMHDHGDDARTAALAAGFSRLRPVLMTALAMVIGMIPMSLGLGEGGEQNAPLGRAVIGGLCMATIATLFFVPAVFSYIHGRRNDKLQRTNMATAETHVADANQHSDASNTHPDPNPI